jgi:hypothetical protein
MCKKIKLYFLTITILFFYGCTSNENKSNRVIKKEVKENKKIEEPKLGDELFIGFRVNMNQNQILDKIKELRSKNKLERFGEITYGYRFLIDDLDFRMSFYFRSKGKEFYFKEKNEKYRLDEIILNETVCHDLIGEKGVHTLTGECFPEINRKKLLQLYLSKYKFEKIEKTLINQSIYRFLNEKEREREALKPVGKRGAINIIKLPNGKSILYYNKDKGISIRCVYGYSEENTRTIGFKKIEIRYLTKERIDAQIEYFNEYLRINAENEKEKKEEEEDRKLKKNETLEDI